MDPADSETETVEVNREALETVLRGAEEEIRDLEDLEMDAGPLAEAHEEVSEALDSDQNGTNGESTSLSDLVTVDDENRTIQIAEPDSTEDFIELDIEGVVGNGLGDSILLTFHNDRPAIYIWQPNYEDVRFAVAPPTDNDPVVRKLIYEGTPMKPKGEV